MTNSHTTMSFDTKQARALCAWAIGSTPTGSCADKRPTRVGLCWYLIHWRCAKSFDTSVTSVKSLLPVAFEAVSGSELRLIGVVTVCL
jgi:hypothetical protein